MAGLFDFLTQAREAGRGARAGLEDSITYYIPPELRGLLGLAAEANPVVSMERAGQDAQRLVQPDLSGWDRMAAAGDMASNMAGVLAPMAAGRAVGMPAVRAAQEGLLGLSMTPEAAALRQFGGDEFGGFTLYQGSPHNFAAERLVRMPDGSTQYVVGAPDRLPDVPAGAEVLQDFPLGRQRMDKIGTGEGAQAYGYGLYGAENEGVARGYRDILSARAAPNDARGNAFDLVQRMGGDEAATAEILRDAISSTPSPNTQQFLSDTLRHIEDKTYADFERPLGSMYELNINANPEDFLDWDVPFSEQSQSVRDAMGPRLDAFRELGAGISRDPSGSEIHRAAYPTVQLDEVDWSRDLSAQATDRLREAGIPGIRYLDAGSRGANDGTRNYVIFDENLINIVRKYGIAGAAAMLGMSQADVAQAMGQQPQGLLESGPQ